MKTDGTVETRANRSHLPVTPVRPPPPAYQHSCFCWAKLVFLPPNSNSVKALQTTKTLMKKRSETQTLRAGCSKAAPKIFAPPQTAFPGAQDRQNLISWRWSLYLQLQTRFGEDRCTQFRFIMVTDTARPPQTHTQDRLQYTAPLASAQCNYNDI